MAYADQQMSGSKITALIIVIVIHVALITGLYLAFESDVGKKIVQKLTTVDIKEPEKPKPPPPPPPKEKQAPPPPVAPPVKINVAVTPPPITTVQQAPPPPPVIQLPAPQAPPLPPPAPKGPSSPPQPRGDPQSWVSSDDYPARALRSQEQGVTGFRLTIGTDGRVSNCEITSSSGFADLDQTVCSLMTRRGKFKPAMQDGQPTSSTFTRSFRWVVPKD